MARINRNQSYLQECTAGQIQPVARRGQVIGSGGGGGGIASQSQNYKHVLTAF